MTNYLTYETKCRRCEKLHKWAFGKSCEESNEENWLKLHKWVGEHMTFPCVNNCDNCDKGTLQDIVSYTDKGWVKG